MTSINNGCSECGAVVGGRFGEADEGNAAIVSATNSKQSVNVECTDSSLSASVSIGGNDQETGVKTTGGGNSNQVFGDHISHDAAGDRQFNGIDKKHDAYGVGATPNDNGGAWAFDSENPELVLFKLGQGRYYITIPVHKSDVFQFTSNLLGDLFRINKEAGDWRRAYENQLKQTLLLSKTNSATLKEVYGRLKTVTLQREEADRQETARFMKTMEKRGKRLSK